MKHLHHRLAAVWFADIVGYTSLTRQNEAQALSAVRLFQRVVDEKISRYGGHLVKFTGDGAFAEFSSTQSAVLSACALRQAFVERSRKAELGDQDVRVGVHLGEVAEMPDGDVYGEGVNMAARIMELASPGQVLVGGDVYQQLHHRPEFRFNLIGEREVKGGGAVTLYGVAIDPTNAPLKEEGEGQGRLRSLLSELTRRRVLAAAAAYTFIALLVIIAAIAGFRALFLPAWIAKWIVIFVVLGLPIVIGLSWMFRFTSAGVRRHARFAVAESYPWLASEQLSPRFWPIALAVGLLILLGTGTVAILNRWPLQMPAMSSHRVAVFPFSVRGGEEIAYLGEGMVDLLATKLDGAGDYESVDPHALMEFLGRNRIGNTDPGEGRAVAERFGAELYVLGSIVEAGDRLHIDARMYRTGSSAAVTQVSIEGKRDELMILVDRLAGMLLAAGPDQEGTTLTSLAAMTTDSLAALEAYLRGEQEYKAGQFTSAIEEFQRAVAIDTLFALAFYRLAISAAWVPDNSLVEEAAEKALRHSARLSPPDRVLVEALYALETIQPERVSSLLRPYLRSHPEDVEAWYIYGDALFHYSELRGRSIAEAREPFERAVRLDPDNNTLVIHLMEIAASEQDFAVMDSLLRSGDQLSEFELHWRALRAFAIGSDGEQRRILAELSEASDQQLRLAVQKLAGYSPEGRGVEEAVDLMLQPGRPSDVHRAGRLWRVQIGVRAGRWEDVKVELEMLRSLDRARSVQFLGLYSVLPFLPIETAELQSALDEVRDWSPDSDPEQSSGDFDGLYRQYLIGLLSARLGQRNGVVAAIRELDQQGGTKQEVDVARFLKMNLEAHQARARGRPEAALRILSDSPIELRELPASELSASPFIWHPYERFIRAELLLEQDRLEEAIGWYAVLTEGLVWLNLPYAPIAHLRLATIHERLGNSAEAVGHYSSFVALWKDCDPALRPVVVDAQRRLQRLISRTTSG